MDRWKGFLEKLSLSFSRSRDFLASFFSDSSYDDEDERIPAPVTDNSRKAEISDGFLQFFKDGLRLRVDLKSNGVTRVGNSWRNDCSIPTDDVKNVGQAEFMYTGGQYEVRNASGQVRVDGVPLAANQTAVLSHGDVICLCGVDMKFLKRSQLYAVALADAKQKGKWPI